MILAEMNSLFCSHMLLTSLVKMILALILLPGDKVCGYLLKKNVLLKILIMMNATTTSLLVRRVNGLLIQDSNTMVVVLSR